MILKNENPTIKVGLFAIFLLVGVFGIWIGLAPLSSAAVAVGQVDVLDNKKIIQHLEGGVISKIFVKDGDVVKAGDPLLEIKNARLDSEIEIIRSELLQTSVLMSRLQAQKDDAKSIKFDDFIKKFSGFKEAKKAQISIFNEQNKLLADEINILNQRISQLQNQITGTKALLSAKQDRIKSLSEEIKEWDRLFKEQLTDKIKLRDLNREKTAVQGDVAATESDIAKLNVQISETKSQIIVRERTFKEDVLKRLEDTKSRLIDLKQKYNALKDQSQRAILKAPVDGTIVELAFHTIGGVVRSGEKIMAIVPNSTKYIINAKLRITDIDTVHVGLPADMRFSAFNSRQSHVMEGNVTYISADSLKDERGFPYYELKAELTKRGKEELKENKFFLVPGMPAEVIVKTGERTVLNYILKPFLDMFERAFNED